MSDVLLEIKRENIKPFILGGNAKFIVEDNRTGKIERYKLHLYKNRYMQDNVSVSVDNIWLGYFSLISFTFSQTYNRQGKDWAQEFLDLVNNNMLPDDIKVYHIGKCGACGRDLTDPLSMYIGIGPTCRSRMRKAYPQLPK